MRAPGRRYGCPGDGAGGPALGAVLRGAEGHSPVPRCSRGFGCSPGCGWVSGLWVHVDLLLHQRRQVLLLGAALSPFRAQPFLMPPPFLASFFNFFFFSFSSHFTVIILLLARDNCEEKEV